MEETSPFAVNEMHLYTRYWKKVAIFGILLYVLFMIYTVMIIPNLDMTALENYMENQAGEMPEIPLSYSLFSILIFGFGITFLWNYIRMFRFLNIAQRISHHPQLRKAFKVNLAYLAIFVIEVFIPWFIVLFILEIAAKVLLIVQMLALRQYIFNFADHTPRPNESEPVDKAIQLYAILASLAIVLYIIANFIPSENFSTILLLSGVIIVNSSSFYLAFQMGKYLSKYADQKVTHRSLFRPFRLQRAPSPQNYSQFSPGPSGIPYPQNENRSREVAHNPSSDSRDGPQIPSDSHFSYSQWSQQSSPASEKLDEDTEFRRCPHCDAKLPKDATVCGYCGAML